MSNEFLDIIKKTPSEIVRGVYPILFWSGILRVLDLMELPTVVPSGPVQTVWSLMFWAGFVYLIIACLAGCAFAWAAIQPYSKIRNEVPQLVHDLLKNPTPRVYSKLRNEIAELLISTKIRFDIQILGLTSGVSQLLSKRRKISYPIQILMFSILIVFTIEISKFLAREFAPLLFDVTRYNFSSVTVVTVLLVLISIVKFAPILEEVQMPFWKTLTTPATKVLRFVMDFAIISNALDIILDGASKIAFGNSQVSGVACPDNVDVSRIIGKVMPKPSLVFEYEFGELYPQRVMQHWIAFDNVREYVKDVQPVAFVGVDRRRERCVLIVTVSMLDVPRMTIWTQSAEMTRNIVTMSRNTMETLRAYE